MASKGFAVLLFCSNEWPRRFSPTSRTIQMPGRGSTPSWSSLRTWKLKYVPDAEKSCELRSAACWQSLNGQCNNVSWCLSTSSQGSQTRQRYLHCSYWIFFKYSNLCFPVFYLSAKLLDFPFSLHLQCEAFVVVVVILSSVVSAVKMLIFLKILTLSWCHCYLVFV